MYYPLSAVYEQAGRNLELAKAADKDCIYLLGRMLEWRHLADAAELKDTVTRLVHEFRMSRQFLLRAAQLLPQARRTATGAGGCSARGGSSGGSTASWRARATASSRSCGRT